ncbi:MAG: hypothetical protein ACI4QY_04975, partial [Oscillospiraceae bacterium]
MTTQSKNKNRQGESFYTDAFSLPFSNANYLITTLKRPHFREVALYRIDYYISKMTVEKTSDARIIRFAKNAETAPRLGFVLVAPLLGGVLAAILRQPANIV